MYLRDKRPDKACKTTVFHLQVIMLMYDVIVADYIWSDDIVRPTIMKQNLFTKFLLC